MWNDVETTQDLLNFKVVADTATQMIKDGNGQTVSIGVSGSWGVGKSSLVQMIGESLKSLDGGKNYIFINFNAWLYQGYDDARMALLQKVAYKIMEESESRKTCVDKAKEFIKRINWLRTAKFMAPVFGGQADSILTSMRDVLRDNIQKTAFPLEAIIERYKATNKDLRFDDDYIESLLDIQAS
ncbi:MAG: hypothetical protein HQK75_06295 [Candidatus Magnetomorum sp.]|nr:hypothetical protein [Candidatus Magnetomorum sp.]